MFDDLSLEPDVAAFMEKLKSVHRTDEQEYDKLAAMMLEAAACILDQERFHLALCAMPEDFALAFCKSLIAFLCKTMSHEA